VVLYLESEVVISHVAIVDDGGVELLSVLDDKCVHVVGEHGRLLVRLGLDVVVQYGSRLAEALFGRLVQVGHADARGQHAEVRVQRRQVRGGLGGKLVQLKRRHALVHALHHLREGARIHTTAQRRGAVSAGAALGPSSEQQLRSAESARRAARHAPSATRGRGLRSH
jgi:hypothetical protein